MNKINKLRLVALIIISISFLFYVFSAFFFAININKFPDFLHLQFNSKNKDVTKSLSFFFFVFAIINGLFVYLNFKILNDNQKHKWIGIFEIIFGNVICGILILISNKKFSDNIVEQESIE
ncbi:MAG: hypothetical protein LBF02_02530 [Mycoplasmataceae bacterium]|jgi:uncharacterized BrkB/YihY/UPF0761 family membrane protein|nr:hypothetical protein [Mycoplasmataceae bacterium]